MKDFLANLKKQIEGFKTQLQKLLNKSDDELEEDEELFDSEESSSDDDEKTIVHNLDEFKASQQEETETSVEPGAQAASGDTTVSTNAESSDSTSQFDINATQSDFTAGDLTSSDFSSSEDNEDEFDLDDDDIDDGFESAFTKNKSHIIRAVVVLAIVYFAADEFLLNKDVQQPKPIQKVTRKKVRRIKKKIVQPQEKKQLEMKVVEEEKKTQEIEQPVVAKEITEPPREKRVARQPIEQVNDPSKEQVMDQPKTEEPIAQTPTNQEDEDKIEQPMNEASMETPSDSIANQDPQDPAEEKSMDNNEVDNELNISPVAQLELQNKLEEAEERIAQLEADKKKAFNRAPASAEMEKDSPMIQQQEERSSVINEFDLKEAQTLRSKESLAFVKTMIPDPAVQYEYKESPNFKDKNLLLGRGLVYNCAGKHWACVPKQSYYQCRDHAKWSISKKKEPDCVVNSVYVSLKSCKDAQSLKIGQIAVADFCKGQEEKEREPASVEIDDSDVPYETGL